jgi:hypothetical protein
MARFASLRFVSVGVSAAMVAVFGVVLSAVPGGESAPAGAAPTATPAYDSTVAPLPGNLVSVGFEATQTSQFGDQVALGGTARELNNVVVTMSSWGCQSGAGNNGFGTANACVTTPGATFSEPITLNIYSVGLNNVPGSLLATDTQTFAIPYRPSASDPTGHSAAGCTASGGQWFDSADGTCDNGLATNITFALSSQNVVLPNNVIYGIAYNTSDYGAVPYGDATACHAAVSGCAYDSLNVGLNQDPTNVSVGSDPNPGTVYWNTATANNYCDKGVGGTGTFRIDGAANSSSCWDGGANTGWSASGTGSPYYVPAVQINTTPTPSNTVVVTPPNLVTASPTAGQFLVTNESGGAGSVGIVSGPAGGPTADSLQMTTTGTSDHWDAFNYDRDGTLLSNISTLSYSAYTNNAPTFDPVFQLQANLGSGIPFATVNYEPYEQTTPDTANTWQSFNVTNGVVWATHIASNAPGGIDDPISWSSFVNLFPGASLLGVGADVGSAWPAMSGNVDALSIGTDGANGSTTTYDFNNPPPTTSIVLPSTGATLSGSTYLDATATNATSVQFFVFGGSFGFNAPLACTATGTVFGWVCGWNTTSVPNGSYTLVAQATGPGGSTDAGIAFKVNNPAPTTSIILPSAGATLSGSTYLDATATNATSVEFLVFGGSFGFNSPVACTATGTIYGWLCGWNTTSVPNSGSYTLVAQATGPGGTTYSAGVKFTVNN